MNLQKELQLSDLRRKDMIRETAEYRRAQEISGDSQGTGFHRPVLARLGRMMSGLGDSLQTRYGNQTTNPESYQYKSA